jgi:hypothetical protein
MPILEVSDPIEPLMIPVTLVASSNAWSVDKPEPPDGSATGIED